MNFHDNENNTSSNSPIVASSSMVDIGSEVLSRGDENTALHFFDTAHRMLAVAAPSTSSISLTVKHIQLGTEYLTTDSLDVSQRIEDSFSSSLCPPDIYHDDEADVGPRVLSTPVLLDLHATAPLENSIVFLEAVTLFNKALVQHSMSRIDEAKQIYELLVRSIQKLLFAAANTPSTALLAMAMRVYNNLGLTSYADGEDAHALIYFQQALLVSAQLFGLSHSFRFEHATVLSNWCRVIWLRGDVNEPFFAGLREVLRIRSNLLAWDHPDVAAAHYNLATAEYTRKNNAEAVFHLKQYLRVAAHRRQKSEQSSSSLDPMPAMIYLLLLQNENQEDDISQELVRGLHTLQDKRHDEGNDSSEVASVLNFIGTLLFHKGDLDDALVFFLEELRLEELFVADGEQDMSVSVTCNNIGRIFQERGKYDQAISYYERALKPVYGDPLDYETCANKHSNISEIDAASKNLYSTVWYNLGLIHDKSTAYPEAIGCFKMSLELRSSILGRDHPDVACLHFNISLLQTEQQQLDEAAVSLKKALRARDSGTAASSNKLSDHRFIKTLEKLATLQKNKGNIQAAVDAWQVALGIVEVSPDIDSISRIEYMALVLRSISELHHAAGDLKAALVAALQSGRKLEALCAAYYGNSMMSTENKSGSRMSHIEQLVSTLLLVGSLHHEMCEPLRADAILGQAKVVLEYAARTYKQQPLPASLLALREVASMLVTERCAPQA